MYTGHIAPWRPSGSFGARRRGVGALKGIETHGRTEFCQSCRTRPSCVDSPLLTIRTSSDFVKDRIRLCSDPSKALTGLVCAMQAALAAPSAFAWRAPTATHSAANAKVARVTVCRGESGEASSSGRGAVQQSPVKATGLSNTPITGALSAAQRHDLPPPVVAVRNLMEQASYAQLCTVMSEMHHRRTGYPFGTLVDFTTDGAGKPIFCLSPLGIHTHNILANPSVCLVVQAPGWSGLANASVTIFGDVYELPPESEEAARSLFAQKHNMDGGRWVTGGYSFFRMHNLVDVYFTGGFGTVQWIDTRAYERTQPDDVVSGELFQTLEALNRAHSESLKDLLTALHGDARVDDCMIISIDKLGCEVRVRRGQAITIERIGFDNHVRTLADAQREMERITQDSRSFERHRVL